jgi:aldose 1-epimerase
VSARSPSGEQYEIAFDAQRAVVTEVGAGLRTYDSGERRILDGYDADAMSPAGRGQVLAPWPNRIADGTYEFGGRTHTLALTEPERGNAIHGLVRWDAWSALERGPHRVVLAHELYPQPGYPFALSLRIEYALSTEGLRVSTTATNAGANPCPFGAGAHPYLLPGTPTVDSATLHLPARRVLDGNDWSSVQGTEFDFEEPRAIGATKLDHCFTDLMRGDGGLARVELADPAAGTSVTLWVDESYGYLMLYTGDDRPDVSRRSLAVEPMTCPPQAFRTGESVIVLAAGDSMTASWGLTPQ